MHFSHGALRIMLIETIYIRIRGHPGKDDASFIGARHEPF